MDGILGYILQGVTIAITLALGLFNNFQTKKLQHGQNILSVTTNYRMKRSEQLKECGQKLVANTSPSLLSLGSNNDDLLIEACEACETISMILHRHFVYDKELIDIAFDIYELAVVYKSDLNNQKLQLDLEFKRNIFRLKCDIYTAAEWNRIKSETKGINSSADEWLEYYKSIEAAFIDEFDEIKRKYEQEISLLNCSEQ